MSSSKRDERKRLSKLDRDELAAYQVQQLRELLDTVLPSNEFYSERLSEYDLKIKSLDDLQTLPLTHKDDLFDPDPEVAAARHHTYPLPRYARYHQTSGTRGTPLVIYDTADDWKWWIDTWQYVLDMAEVGPSDRALLAFSFGPFIGFWSAHDALAARGAMVVPAGGLSTLARLELIRKSEATVVCCTPTYALRLAEVAAQEGIDLPQTDVRRIIVAGEPGGSVPGIRERIQQAWEAKVIDHSGATEVGPWGCGDRHGTGIYVIESEFIAETLIPGTTDPSPLGEVGELVLTLLGRFGAPLIRYRTGDLVRPIHQSDDRWNFLFLEGGVLGRADDMLVVRGVNIFPSAVEGILREFEQVDEYRMIVTREGTMDQLTIEVEDSAHDPRRIADKLEVRLGLRVEVSEVESGSLPRFEAKGKRLVDEREET